jgi:predicted Zn-dependent protease
VVTEATVQAQAAARKVLAYASAAGASQAEVLFSDGDSALTRFANSEIHQNVAERDAQVSIRYVDGRRVGCAATNRLDDEALRRLADRAGAIARLQPEQPEAVELPEPGPMTLVAGVSSEATRVATPESRAAGAREVIAAADAVGVLAYGSFTTSVQRIGVINSKGVDVIEERTSASLITVSMGGDGEAGYASSSAVDVTDIDAEALGVEAAERARDSRGAVAIEPGDYPVVLEPYAVADLLEILGYVGFSALAVQEDRSFHEPGRIVGSELVTIVDDAADPAGIPASFDYEGVPKEPVTLIERGVCRDVVFDAQTAKRAGRNSTGHGLPAPNSYGPFPLNMLMAPGDATHDELVAGLDRGLLVTRFHYTNPVHPKLAIVTGMTRDGLFLVERGEIVGPVRNLRFTQSYLAALAGVEAVARDRRRVAGDFSPVVVPAVRIAAFTFTGVTEH